MVKHHRMSTRDEEGVTVVTFLDASELVESSVRILVESLSDVASSVVSSPWRRGLVLNFEYVHDISRPAMLELLHLNRKMAAAGGRLILCGLRPHLRKAFRNSGLGMPLSIRDQEFEAVRVLSGA